MRGGGAAAGSAVSSTFRSSGRDGGAWRCHACGPAANRRLLGYSHSTQSAPARSRAGPAPGGADMVTAERAANAAPRSVAAQVLEDGFFAGIIGAGLVAAWYLLLDLINQRPLYTPSMLGAVLFRGATD